MCARSNLDKVLVQVLGPDEEARVVTVKAHDRSGLRGALELVDAEHGDTIAFFNFGFRKGAAREVLAALN